MELKIYEFGEIFFILSFLQNNFMLLTILSATFFFEIKTISKKKKEERRKIEILTQECLEKIFGGSL